MFSHCSPLTVVAHFRSMVMPSTRTTGETQKVIVSYSLTHLPTGGQPRCRSTHSCRVALVMTGDLAALGDHALGRRAVKPVDTQRPCCRGRGHGDVRTPEQLLQRTALGVDGLDPRDGSDPSLLTDPAGLGEDGRCRDLSTMNALPPTRHDHEARRREQDPAAPRRVGTRSSPANHSGSWKPLIGPCMRAIMAPHAPETCSTPTSTSISPPTRMSAAACRRGQS